MTLPRRRFLHVAAGAAALPIVLTATIGALAQSCAGQPIAVQVLGSGGPAAKPDRASASYLLWVGNEAKVLIDMGGGAFLRFGQSGANLRDLAVVAISHLHPDHVSDLPALLWSPNQVRRNPLPIMGPSGNETAPDLATFLDGLFDGRRGTFRVLGSVLGASGNFEVRTRLDVQIIDVTKAKGSMVFDREGLTVTAFAIPHGEIPALAYRVTTRNTSVVFSTDQNGTNSQFAEFANGADVLVMHLAIASGTTGFLTLLHATPELVGRTAQNASIGRLIVSHIGQFDVDAAVADLRKSYAGPLTVATDLQCTQVR
jgi:ribonuclease BN (tRNA processing enzyme)